MQLLIQNNVNSESLQIFLSCLSQTKRTENLNEKASELLVISFIAKTFNTELIHPNEKSLIKTVFRLVQMIHSYFSNFY